ncbi:MAG: hypothetical protein KVP17_004389 [Porospora cf. gigantea B]|uniref:uncharacterized protein n=1 Tax=Porospora cf. gigantea B TaxID=2853592 RepID=UPI00357180CB|nr:MAG: hypothetical protein KVP17_004389 [Porospora cf. gigantea B]
MQSRSRTETQTSISLPRHRTCLNTTDVDGKLHFEFSPLSLTVVSGQTPHRIIDYPERFNQRWMLLKSADPSSFRFLRGMYRRLVRRKRSVEWIRRWKAFTSLVWPRIQARHNRRMARNLSSVLACKTFLAERYIVDRNCYNYTSLDEMAEERRRRNMRTG